MRIICHRRNTIKDLAETHPRYGVEVDIRTCGLDLIIHHDAFNDGCLFQDWIREYKHKTLILNVKEEGLEQRLLKILNEHGISDFFFLDQSFPFLLKTVNSGESRVALRVSEYESISTALKLAGRAEWIWVDCFSEFPLKESDVSTLNAAGFKLCIVSPELQGRNAENEIKKFKHLFDSLGFSPTAVCTKRPDLWE